MMQILTIRLLFIGTTELLLIGGMALLLFGGKKLPEMMRGLGQGVKEFKKGMDDVKGPPAEDGAAEEADEDGTNGELHDDAPQKDERTAAEATGETRRHE